MRGKRVKSCTAVDKEKPLRALLSEAFLHFLNKTLIHFRTQYELAFLYIIN